MTFLVLLAGALIQVAQAGIVGLFIHKWLIARAPGLAIPRDAGVVLGLLCGVLLRL